MCFNQKLSYDYFVNLLTKYEQATSILDTYFYSDYSYLLNVGHFCITMHILYILNSLHTFSVLWSTIRSLQMTETKISNVFCCGFQTAFNFFCSLNTHFNFRKSTTQTEAPTGNARTGSCAKMTTQNTHLVNS